MAGMAKVPKSLRFSEDVWSAIDAAAANVGISRQVWFDRLVANTLGLEVGSANTIPPDRVTAALHPPAGCLKDPESTALADRTEIFGRLQPRAPGGVIGGRGKE